MADSKPQAQLNYPETRQDSAAVDTYFNTAVPDPYRWLEDDRSEETEQWVKAQNKLTQGYLADIPYRDDLKGRLKKLWNYPKLSAPTRHGDYMYFSKNDGLQDQSVLYRYPVAGQRSDAQVFLDPNQFSEDGTTSLAGISFSKDGSRAAYQISEGGADWRKVIVIDTEKGQQIGDTLRNVKFSGLAWRGNEGFYYASYDRPEGSKLSSQTDHHKLYFHQLHTPQKEDKLIFGNERKRRYVGGNLTEDENFLVITAAQSTTGNELYIQDLRIKDSSIQPVVADFESDQAVIHSRQDSLWIETNRGAPNGKVVVTSVDRLAPEHWVDLIPETENVLNVSTGGGKLFAQYMVDAVDRVYQYNWAGQRESEIALPGNGSVGGFSGRKEDSVLYYAYTSYIYPSTIYRYEVKTGQSEVYYQSPVDFDPAQYTSRQVFYRSKDGTRIPMIITHKKGLERDGTNPTLLYGYGGFNISLTPGFSTGRIPWLEQGGIYAVPNIRGGGEYGEAWHQAGTKMKKQNVFDDFIAAAQYLIDSGYTRSDKLAISGGSNGGLLVGAVMTQRPDLMQVALPAVGVLDMLRYHKFTAGAGWHTDYGTSEDSQEMFQYLYDYSPLHNLEKGVSYPATLITTGDHDDRVVPAHSFKFAATLQEKHTGEDPVLIRIETKAGHGAGKPTDMVIQELADKWAFTLRNLDFQKLPRPYGQEEKES
jgi:prolyl oligopeptidase